MIREIHIKPALNGYVCAVGCQIVVFNDRRTLCDQLEAYLRDPSGTEAHFLKTAVNPMETPAPPTGLGQTTVCDSEAALSPCPPQTERNPVLRPR